MNKKIYRINKIVDVEKEEGWKTVERDEKGLNERV